MAALGSQHVRAMHAPPPGSVAHSATRGRTISGLRFLLAKLYRTAGYHSELDVRERDVSVVEPLCANVREAWLAILQMLKNTIDHVKYGPGRECIPRADSSGGEF